MTPKSKQFSKSSDPKSMEELLSMYGGSIVGVSSGDRIKGRVLSIGTDRVIVDIGTKSEGLVAEKAFNEAQGFIKNLKVGDVVETYVLVSETQDGTTILSLRPAMEALALAEVEKAQKEEGKIEVEGRGANASGVSVGFYGMPGFIPSTQLSKVASKNPQSLVGKTFEVVVIDFDKNGRKLILSEKEVTDAADIKLSKKAFEKISEGDIFDGVISSVYDFGCFVRISVKSEDSDVELEGLVHVSEISWQKVDNPVNAVSVGQKIKVKVIGKNLPAGRQETRKLAFSIKQTEENPWKEIAKKYKKDQKVKGEVTRISNFGIFVMLTPGVEGLVHMTKIPPGKRFSEGDEVDVYIEEIDIDAHKISLGLVLTAKPIGYK